MCSTSQRDAWFVTAALMSCCRNIELLPQDMDLLKKYNLPTDMVLVSGGELTADQS